MKEKKERRINRYTVYTEFVFLNKTDVYASSEKEAISMMRDATGKTNIFQDQINICQKYCRIPKAELKEKNIKLDKSKMFIYEDTIKDEEKPTMFIYEE